jgi:hypothetical protein
VPTPSHEAEGHIISGVMRESLVDPARSENPCMRGIFMGENREVPILARMADHRAGRSGKAEVVRLRCTSLGSQTVP